ncbi:MAG: hypothetical protein ACQESP_13605 [Candidatus Muiribacteriota bacterium]
MKSCKICLLPGEVPEANINSSGICSFCRGEKKSDYEVDEELRKAWKKDLEKALSDCKGKGEYDCLVPISGGKDSLYLAYKLKYEYGLKVLGYTTNINIPDIAHENIKTCLNKIDIRHYSDTPPDSFYRKIFSYLLKNQEERGAVYTISYVYAPLFEGDAIRLAIEKNIPLVLAGYSPGQPEPERMTYEFSRKLICETDWTPPGLIKDNVIDNDEIDFFYNPKKYPKGTNFPRYLAPFHAWDYNQDKIMKFVVEKGLVKSKKHASPIYSNYPINWLLMYSDLKFFGYNPYHPEFSQLIRDGKASRTYWRIMAPVVNFMIRNMAFLGKDAKRSMEWLGINEKDLQITKPKGYYDPEIPS